MNRKPKKAQREKDLTSRYMSGGYDEDRADAREHFSPGGQKAKTQEKIARTALMRADEESGADIDTLPVGHVIQVHSLFCDVEHENRTFLASVRRTLTKVRDGYVVVGDRVSFRAKAEAPADSLADDPSLASPDVAPLQRVAKAPREAVARGQMPEAVIERILPRQTILSRTDSFKAIEQHPIVANAEQMLIVASLRHPRIKWGLVDRMLAAAQAGGLSPVLCMNKIDLIEGGDVDASAPDLVQARAALEHYAAMGVRVIRTSAERKIGLDVLRDLLRGRETVLAGHSGVGKSTLINAIQDNLNLRIGDISGYTGKGRHTTTSARRYPLDGGGAVIDTPGVKLFGLWGVTAKTLIEYFPDVAAGNPPAWRQESYDRIAESLGSR